MTIYLTIALSPLAPLAMHSKVVTHAVTGECSGDCTICGCSLESRTNQTCCCAKKQRMEQREHDDAEDTPECCKKKQSQIPVIRCGCPCGDPKQLSLAGIGSFEVLPFQFSDRVDPLHNRALFSNSPDNLISRSADPPDQPPKITLPAKNRLTTLHT